MADQETSKKAPTPEWPKRFKNFAQHPLPLDPPTLGAISLPGKALVWLWPEDVASTMVQQAIANGLLIDWEDPSIEKPLARPGQEPEVAVDTATLDAAPAAPKNVAGAAPQARTFAQVLDEDQDAAGVPLVTKTNTPPDMVSSGVTKADSGPKRK